MVLTAMNGVPWWFFHGFGGDVPRHAARRRSIPDGADRRGDCRRDASSAASSMRRCSTPEPGLVRHHVGHRLIVGEPARRARRRASTRDCARSWRAAGFDVEVSTLHPARHLVQAVGQHDDESGVRADRRDDGPHPRRRAGERLLPRGDARGRGDRREDRLPDRAERRGPQSRVTRQLGAVKTSMLQDVEAARPVEIDVLLTRRARDRRAGRGRHAGDRCAARPGAAAGEGARALPVVAHASCGPRQSLLQWAYRRDRGSDFVHRTFAMNDKKFASQADLEEKKVSFDKLSDHAYAYTAEGDPNTGIVIGDDAVMVIDTQATPVMAQDVIRRIREVTDKPIKYVVLSHYHAVRVLGASGYKPRAHHRQPRHLRPDRRARRADMKSEIERFPRLFRAVESVPGLTWPTIVFEKRHDAVARQAAGRDHAARARPHQGRHGRLAAAGEDPVLRRPRRVRRDAVHRRCLPHRLAGDARRDRGAASRRSSCRAAARRCTTPPQVAGGPRRHARLRHRDVRRACKRGARRGQGPAHRLQGNLRRAQAEVRRTG